VFEIEQSRFPTAHGLGCDIPHHRWNTPARLQMPIRQLVQAGLIGVEQRAIPGNAQNRIGFSDGNLARVWISLSARLCSVLSRTTQINPPLVIAVKDRYCENLLPFFFVPMVSPCQSLFDQTQA